MESYSYFHLRQKGLDERKKQLEADIIQFHVEFNAFARKDFDLFEHYRIDAKSLIDKKASPEELDQVYTYLALIYKKWLPIEDDIRSRNPTYSKLFDLLKERIVKQDF